jgi:uncharacterized protein (TIGR03067 family)
MLAKRLARQGVVVSGGALAEVMSQKAASACVPPSMVSSTIKAASLFAAGQAGAPVISVRVAALLEGVLKAMFLNTLKSITAGVLVVLLGVGVIGTGFEAIGPHVLQAKQPDKPGDGLTKQVAQLPVGKGKKPATDEERLQGVWRLEEVAEDGKTAKVKESDWEGVVTVRHETLHIKFGQRNKPPLLDSFFVVKLDATTTPKLIDLADWKEGFEKGQVIEGVYSLDSDTLKLCWAWGAFGANREKNRPTTLVTKEGSKTSTWTLKKEAKGQKKQPPGAEKVQGEQPKGDKAAKQARDELEGTWTVLSLESRGRKVYDVAKVPVEKKKLVIISNGKLVFKEGDKTVEMLLKIDPARKPREVDLFLPTLVMGKSIAYQGIYTLEGDTLTACFNQPLQPRPSEFGTKTGDQRVLWILKRSLPPAEGKKEEAWSKTLPLNLGELGRYPPEFIYTPRSDKGKKSKNLQLQGELKLDKEC